MSDWRYDLVATRDGREMEVLQYGTAARALVWWTGTPAAGTPHEELAGICDDLGLRILMPLRPGYGRSTPHPHRSVMDPALDLNVVLDAIGIDEVVSIGFSGGGSHSLATAALVPKSRAASVVVSPAPRDAEGLDFFDGMAWDNQKEWRLADESADAVRPFVEEAVASFTAPDWQAADLFGDCICPSDALASTIPARKVMLAASLRKAFEHGCEGWLDDDIALVSPWGFGLEQIAKPVSFWAGRQDLFVSFRHSVWMHERVGGSDLHVWGEYGHFGLAVFQLRVLIQDLVGRAKW